MRERQRYESEREREMRDYPSRLSESTMRWLPQLRPVLLVTYAIRVDDDSDNAL